MLAKSRKPYSIRVLDDKKVAIFSAIEQSFAIDEEVLVKWVRSARQLRLSAFAVFLP